MTGLPGVEADFSPILRKPELDLKIGLGLETRLEGIRRTERLLGAKSGREKKQDGRGATDPHASIGRSSPDTRKAACVLARISSTVTSGAISTSTSSLPSRSTSKTQRSVMILWTQRLPVRGSVQAFRILGSPLLAVCSIVTTSRRAPATRSIAPPIPFTILPGIM